MGLQTKEPGRELADPASASAEDGLRMPAALPLTLHLHDRIEPLETQWRLIEADNHLSLHQSFDWCRAWVETHDCRLLIVEGVCDGRIRFILPLEILRHGPVRIARFIASDFSNINTGLYTDEFRAPSGAQLLHQALRQARRQLAGFFDLLVLEKVPLDWRGVACPFAGLPSTVNQNAAFQLELFADFDQTLEQLNARRRRKRFRSSERRFSSLGGYEHVVAQEREQSLDLLELFFRQKAARFEAMGLPDVFHDEQTRSFFRRLVTMPAAGEDYPLRLHALRLRGEHEGHIAAITGLSRKGDHVICQFGSIDDSIAADASPGEFLFHLAIERLCGDGSRLFDFGIGDQPYKRSWCRIETVQHDLLFPVTMAGRAAAVTHRAKTTVKRFIKQNPQIYAVVRRIRFGKAGSDRSVDAD